MKKYLFEGTNFENVVVFSSEKFGEIRVIVDTDGTVLYAGVDLASCVGYAAPSKVIARSGISGRKLRVPWVFKNRQGSTETKCFTEREANSFIDKGMIPPKGFKSWFRNEVVPQARNIRTDKDVEIGQTDEQKFAECIQAVKSPSPQPVESQSGEPILAELDRIITEILTLKLQLTGQLKRA